MKLEVDGYRATHQILVPVFSIMNKYYMCGGESKSKLYQIDNPGDIFFTPAGHECLLHILSLPYQNMEGNPRVVFERQRDHRPFRVLCVPTNCHRGECNNKWDQYRWAFVWSCFITLLIHMFYSYDYFSPSEIGDLSPYKLVDYAHIPVDHKFSVHVIDISDRKNFDVLRI